MNHRRLPLCTLALVAVALTVDASAQLSGWFAFERASIQSGQLWRVITGHLVHELPRLAVLDLFALALLGAWIERVHRRVLLWVLLASALFASCAILLFTSYERTLGSSALACGLFVAAVVLAHRDGHRTVALVLGLAFAGKLALEGLGLWPAGLGSLPAGTETALAGHIGGALGGLAAFLETHPGSGSRIGAPLPGPTYEEKSWNPSASTRFPSRSESPSSAS